MPVVPPPAVPSRFNRGGLASARPAATPALEGVTWTYSDVGSATYSGRVDRCDGATWVMIVPPSGTYAAHQTAVAPTRPFPPSRRRTQAKIVTTNPNASGWVLAGTTDAASTVNDTADQLFGASCGKLVTNGAGAQASIRGLAQGQFNLSQWDVEVLIYFPDITHLSPANPMLAYLGNSSLASNFQQTIYRVADGQHFQSGEWFRLRFTCPTTPSTGTPTRDAITDFQLAIRDDNTGNKVTMYLQSVAVVPKHPSFANTALVTFCFDDGWASQWANGMSKLAQYGFPASFFPIIDQLNDVSGEHLTTAQLHQLQDLFGCEIAAHAATAANHNAGYTNIANAALIAEFATMADWARANGFVSQSFAWPRGLFSAATCATASQYWANARTTTPTPMETLPPENAMRIRCRSVQAVDSAATLTGLVDTALAQGQWLIFCFHEVTDAPFGGSSVGVSAFDTLVDYVAAAGIPVMTVGDALRAFDSEPNMEGAGGLELLTAGEEVVSRELLTQGYNFVSGTVKLSYFTARKTEPVNSLRGMSSTTAASGLTLAKMGLYSVDDAGNLTLIASTASDTTLFASASTQYSRATAATARKIRGKRYAFAELFVGTTMPNTPSVAAVGSSTEYQLEPRVAALLAGQADLPASITAASLGSVSNKTYGVVLPT